MSINISETVKRIKAIADEIAANSPDEDSDLCRVRDYLVSAYETLLTSTELPGRKEE